MTLPALHNTGVIYRRILAHFPQDISLAFAYGSGVFKQHGTNQGQMEVRDSSPCAVSVTRGHSDIVVVWPFRLNKVTLMGHFPKRRHASCMSCTFPFFLAVCNVTGDSNNDNRILLGDRFSISAWRGSQCGLSQYHHIDMDIGNQYHTLHHSIM